ncbi:hypothetical protein NDI76_03995 [Halogeometricum sp. S1BR25-6]|uniref:Zinc ribbon domain-containing protein n=1 Tax=Halogeometricum salsisoli TaxID=2950536 RepID=A0ABU2GCH5_9EURY|nr:hypothetical protein [Halogeometricum sp. S1BR25-6]MDS0297894.1 hypothetical protein [Halogeometricum sp. S1BR25-6]
MSIRGAIGETSFPDARVGELADDEASFVAERVRFALQALDTREDSVTTPAAVGTVEGIRRTTDAAAAEIRSPDSDGECPHCGLALPENGPPMCPRCGAPY